MREFFLRIGAPLYFGLKAVRFWPFGRRGFRSGRRLQLSPANAAGAGGAGLSDGIRTADTSSTEESANPLREFFDARTEGPGIWKWEHYFDIYHRHFARFRGREVHIVEIGVFSGGSLQMWKQYFGPQCRVYGIDIEESCRAYEDEQVKIFIGDQADRRFWHDFRRQVPHVDIVIDDGGHFPHQQIVTFEEMFPHLAPGGVFLCEDIHFSRNPFATYMNEVGQSLHAFEKYRESEDMERRISCLAVEFQRWCDSMHTYPYVIALEKRHHPLTEFVAPRHGTVWEPFYGDLRSESATSG
ncbi:MAG: class I SAM-dependent methyltransferase [Planctomycetaceae bacterium]|nr:class I SAM-dependent methyltransferase [Planctomycetaceae bacterium]